MTEPYERGKAGGHLGDKASGIERAEYWRGVNDRSAFGNLNALLIFPLWVIFVLPFKIVIWMLTTWLGRGLLLVLVVVSMWTVSRLDTMARETVDRYAAILALTDADYTRRAVLTLRVSPGTSWQPTGGDAIEIRCTIELAPYGEDFFTRFGDDCARQAESVEFARWQAVKRRYEDERLAAGLNYLQRSRRGEYDPPGYVDDGAPTLSWSRLYLEPDGRTFPPGTIASLPAGTRVFSALGDGEHLMVADYSREAGVYHGRERAEWIEIWSLDILPPDFEAAEALAPE
ncbi:hypothetical protein L2D00_04735 [Hyphomonadaceae bacterium BL14]|nr:hypothetical protein L2D00_04735 [Hyphomonadaceae bacterium BL14]